MASVLVTGAAGYIGSHACVELLGSGHDVIGLDNLSASSPVSIERVTELAGPMDFHVIDLRDRLALARLFASIRVDAVLHFAGVKSVSESVENPRAYYENNVLGSINLIAAMDSAGVRTMVFSSSCTVYGNPERVPVDEDSPLTPVNPYGRSKLIIEQILRDLSASDGRWRISLLRYFNPIGAHPSGRLGELPTGTVNNLMPHVMKAALGQAPAVRVFGGDYETPDGTCVRDYIHVVDVASAHVNSLEYSMCNTGVHAFNLGTGAGVSVLELLRSASAAVGVEIPVQMAERRPGDAVRLYADNRRAMSELGWRPVRTIDDMCRDHWAFQRDHPRGYESVGEPTYAAGAAACDAVAS